MYAFEKSFRFLWNIFQLALGSFLAWFEGSQALDRIIYMEKRNRRDDDVINTELVYMVKRVTFIIGIFQTNPLIQESARQKKIAARLSKSHLDDIEEATKVILENINAMRAWVGQQAIMKMLSDTFVSCKRFFLILRTFFDRIMMMMSSSLLHQKTHTHLIMQSDLITISGSFHLTDFRK